MKKNEQMTNQSHRYCDIREVHLLGALCSNTKSELNCNKTGILSIDTPVIEQWIIDESESREKNTEYMAKDRVLETLDEVI